MDDFKQIAVGVLRGAIAAEGFDDIEHCLTDGKKIVLAARKAYVDFKIGTMSGEIAGVKDIVSILTFVKSATSDCKDIVQDWTALESMIAVISSPTSLAYHVGKDLLVNGVNIYNETRTAITDYSEEKWEDFGYQLGKASAQIIIGKLSVEQLSAMSTE